MIYIVLFSGVICGIISLVSMKKSGHFIKSVFLSVVQGLAALLAVNASGLMTGVTLSINALTVSTSAVFGTAGVIMNLLFKIILA
jgi:hypothetical protein